MAGWKEVVYQKPWNLLAPALIDASGFGAEMTTINIEGNSNGTSTVPCFQQEHEDENEGSREPAHVGKELEYTLLR